MIKGNLATRPFYNERAVHIWLLAVAAAVAAATLFNAAQMIRYSRADTELARQAANDEARATELRAEAARLRATVDRGQIERASLEARLANDLIDRRTFSWTELWNQLEATLPPDVRITSFRPRLDDTRGIAVAISLIARSVDDVQQFMDNLDKTGRFPDIFPPSERINQEGQLETLIEATYLPARPDSSPQATGAPGAAGPRPSADPGPQEPAR